jgi:hypothetical protein
VNLGEKLINIWHNATIKIIGINVLFYRLFIFNRQLAVFIKHLSVADVFPL